MKSFLYFLLLLFSIILSSQGNPTFNQVTEHTFSDGIKTDKLHTFKDYFRSDDETSKLFKKFNKSRHTQRTFNYIGLGIFLTGLATGIILESTYSNSDRFYIAGMFAGAVGASPFLLVGGIAALIKKSRKVKLLEFMNSKNPLGQSKRFLQLDINPAYVSITYRF